MSTNTENNIKDVLINCLSEQLSELELLKSMYPNTDEIVLSNNKIIKEIQSFINNESEYTPSHLDYTLYLRINDMKLEICIDLPTMYPEEEPDIYVRCNQLNRQQETLLNSELSSFVKNNHLGEVCLFNAISWIQDNIENFESNAIVKINDLEEEQKGNEDKLVRLWIYSHHIYNKKKREEIVKKARDLKLSGFCLSGKPGIVCIEGTDANCNEWWKDIKSMTWKKIGIRKTEELDSAAQMKFSGFEEIRVDMSEFSKYMNSLGLNEAFNDVFGLCNE